MRGGSRSWGRRRSSGRAATRRCGNSWRRRDRSPAVLRPQLPGSLGPRGPASLPGGDLNGDRHRHRHPARRRPDPPAGVARARARPRQRVPDDPEPGALRLPDPPAAHRGDRGHDGDRRAGGVRLAADRAEHLHGDRRRRSRGPRGGPRYGDDRLAALDARRAAARLRGDARRGAGGDGGERGDGDDRRRGRRRRFGRVHLPRRGDGERHVDSRGRGPGGADGARGGRVARAGGTEARVARALRLGRWIVAAAVFLGGCARRERVVVGSKNFTESDLLGEIVAQQIERRTSLPVERRFHLGGTFVCHAAITAGGIDLYVEYTGTAYTAVLKHPPVADRDSVYRTVARDYARQFGLVWGKPFGFNNTFAITVRHRDAARYGLRRISDLVRLAPRWKAGFGYEFLERADGFRGLASVYGLRFASPPTAMDLGLTYRALAEGKVDVIAGNSTDGQIQALDLVVLEDDRHYFPPYEAAPVIRQAAITRYPGVAAALDQLAGRISDTEMRRLNALADVEHRDIATIARDWLRASLP